MARKYLDTSRRRVSTTIEGQSMTRQSHKAECDINNIVKRFNRDGVITHLNKHGEQYDDVTGADFTSMMNTVALAQVMFDELPPIVTGKQCC